MNLCENYENEWSTMYATILNLFKLWEYVQLLFEMLKKITNCSISLYSNKYFYIKNGS